MIARPPDDSPDSDDRTKPAFLRRIQIKGYKSIASCDVHLQPLTIFVGRNGSGKSNFIDALAFLRDLIDKGTDAALLAHGGISVFSQQLNTHSLLFELECDFPFAQAAWRAVYRLELSLGGNKQLQIDHESLRVEDSIHRNTCGFTATRGSIGWYGLELLREWMRLKNRVLPDGLVEASNGEPIYPIFLGTQRPDRLLLGVIGVGAFFELVEGMRTIGCFNFHPEAARPPQQSVGSPALQRDGRNLARAIEGLREIDQDDLDRVKRYLASIVPEIEDFEVVPLGDHETIRFRLRSESGAKPLEFNASAMSDGTLRALAALVAAFQIVLPYGHPSVVAIEEPETSLHPAALRALVDALDEATGHTQILLTTHSAELLDNPRIRPENVRVIEMIDGQTVIGNVDEASVEIIRQKLDTLGGLERQSQLQPHGDDLEQQTSLRGSEPEGQ